MSDEFNENLNQDGQGATGQTGNGNYQYNSDGNGTYHSSYSTEYQSNGNGSSYQSSTSQSSGNGYSYQSGNGGGGKKHGGMIALAVILAAAVGVAGGYGVRDSMHQKDTAKTQTEESGTESTEENKSLADASEGSTESSDSSKDSEKKASDELKTTTGAAVVTDVTQVVENVMPSVVSVYNNFTQTTQDFFGQTYAQEGTSTGSGIIISEDKDNDELLIATNNHVVEDADSLEVQFIDESTAEAKIKGTDAGNDLAVIAVSLKDIDSDTLSQIQVATLGDSDELKIGEPVVAIGNALGYGQSVTTGVVSALDRELQVENVSGTFIQTDAAINPGNSGGPLVDLNGNVIGINSSKIGGEKVDSMGFAIPISRAVPIIENLMSQKTKETVAEEDRGYLGISGVSVTSQVASAYDMPEGVYVAQIIDGGGAADSDLQKGDIITAIEGSSVTDMEALQKQLTYYAAGDKIKLTVERQDGSGTYEEQTVEVTLGDKSAIQKYEDDQNNSQKDSSKHSFGYKNGGKSGSEDSSSDSTEDHSGDAGTDESGDADTESGDDSESQYYSFPFGDLFGRN